jgi:hypothetical protein
MTKAKRLLTLLTPMRKEFFCLSVCRTNEKNTKVDILLPLQGGWLVGETRNPGRRGVPLALGYDTLPLQGGFLFPLLTRRAL